MLDYNRESQSFLMHFPGLTFFFNQIGAQVEVSNRSMNVLLSIEFSIDKSHARSSFSAISTWSITNRLENLYLLWQCSIGIQCSTITSQLL